ncbi:hypothetical protein [Rheinheimera sp. 4Y26]|nr:hypothetical protein [Rheinheimera sp. 4Y26]MCT6699786.1 hypothetical protein [Rheinheimera sp. 4Y26]
MENATFIALGAAALGVIVFSFCIYVAVTASKKKKAAAQCAQADKTDLH